MNKKLTYITLSISFMFSMFAAPVLVHAETSTTGTSPTSTTVTSTPTTVEGSTSESNDDSKGRLTRVAEYKKGLKETLTEAMKVRIAARCEGAQGLVKGRTTNNGVISMARITAYKQIVTKLQSLSAASSASGSDVTALNANIDMLQTKIATFTAANKTYQQALSDAAALDCKTDPTAFKAALEMARTDQKAVLKASQDVRTFLTDIVKVTLKSLKDVAGTTK